MAHAIQGQITRHKGLCVLCLGTTMCGYQIGHLNSSCIRRRISAMVSGIVDRGGENQRAMCVTFATIFSTRRSRSSSSFFFFFLTFDLFFSSQKVALMSKAVGRTHSPHPSDPLQAGQQGLQHQYDGGTFQDIGSTEDARTEKAAKLLAAILVFYSNAMLNPIARSHLPPLLKDLEAFVQTAPSPTTQFLAEGATPLEQQSFSIALSPVGTNTTLLADHLFYTIINLRRPLHSFQTSIEFNARAIFNIVVASVIEGSPIHDCERLLSLCLHLKDNENCYRSFA
ncbi:MAG: hypothetical protein J3Q66DRAFT_134632 [Benniella sp.]|nr:MAG: hypothetical protein J3Q66DRAFT_134632 [Benniella sp.]